MNIPVEPLPFSVSGKTALVTGAGSGINLAFAELLLSHTCNVLIADIALRPEAQSLLDAHASKAVDKPRAMFVKTDVSIWSELNNMFDVADQEFGGADIVCPGAGVFEPQWSNFWHPPGSRESKDPINGSADVGHYATLDINLTHPIRVTQLALSRWLDSATPASPLHPKRIVHVSSIAAQIPNFLAPLYGASKAGLSHFVRSLASLEPALGVRVTAVAPGIIRTPLWTEHPDKLRIFDPAQDTWVEPGAVAAAMLRCCEDAAVPGGAVLEVTGGATRLVAVYADPGPAGPGATISNGNLMGRDILERLHQPGWGKAA